MDSLKTDFSLSSVTAWNSFYEKNNSYQDRWLGDWNLPELATAGSAIEIGCGVGNACIPILKQYPKLFLYATDLSQCAVNTVSARACNEGLDDRLSAFVADAVLDNLVPRMQDPKGVDVACLVFMLSAIRVTDVPALLTNIRGILKHRGILYVRDYALGDFRQSCFPSERQFGSGETFVRGDGTICRFLARSALNEAICSSGFDLVSSSYIKRDLKGHEFARQRVKGDPAAYQSISTPSQEQVHQQRVFIQAKYAVSSSISSSVGSPPAAFGL
jgi:SAM-dependent methyltransferase